MRKATKKEVREMRRQGIEPAVAFSVPQADIVVDDMVRGKITFAAGTIKDFVIRRRKSIRKE